MCITFISYFDKIKSTAKKRTESSGNEIITWRPTGRSTASMVAQLLKQPLKVRAKVCVREIEMKTAVCVSENTSVQLSVLEGEMINLKQRFAQRGETRPNLGSVTD